MQFPPPKLNTPSDDDPGKRPPDRLVSPMGPVPCEVLRREPGSTFGPVDHQPPANNAFSRVQAAASSEWIRHRLGHDPRIRPATIITPSTAGLLDAVGDAIGEARALQLRSATGSAVSAPAQDGQLVVSSGGTNEPRSALQLALPRAVGRFLGTRPTLPSIAQLGLPTVAFQSGAPPRLSLPGRHGMRSPAQPYRFLTHPPNQTPASVTAPMQHAGVWRENGHQVWAVPTGPGAAAHYPAGRAPDTPRLPLRMLDDMPELEARAPASDAEMPDATDTDADGSDDGDELSQNEAPKFVLNALQLNGFEPEFPSGGFTLEDLATAAAAQKNLEDARNDVKEFEVDVENGEQGFETASVQRINEKEVFLADKCSREGEEGGKEKESKGGELIGIGKPGAGGLIGPDGLDPGHVLRDPEPAHGSLLLRSNSSLSSLADSLPSLLWDEGHHPPTPPSRAASLPPLVSDSAYVSRRDSLLGGLSLDQRRDRLYRQRSLWRRRYNLQFPTLSDDSSDEEDLVKLIEAHPYVPSTAAPQEIHDLRSTIPNTWPVTKIEGATGFDFSKRLNKTVRTLPAHAARERAHNITWIKMRQHTIKHEHQRLRMRAEAIDGLLAPIRRADALILRSPNLIDTVDMGTHNMVDLDMLEQLNAPDHTPAGKARRDAQAHELEEILDVLAPPLLDGSRRFIDSPGVPVSVDGKRYREFSEEAKKLLPVHRLAIKAQVLRRRGPMVVYAVVRGCLLETTRLGEDFIRAHGWELNIVDLHQDTYESLPILKDDEHARLRLVMYAFARHGYDEVANAIDDLLAYRFYEPTIIRNLLEAGMLDPNDTIYVDGGPPAGIKIEARNVTGYPKPKRPYPGRYPRNWTQQVLVPSPIPEAFEGSSPDEGGSSGEEEPQPRRARL
ncbi:hypothetical protein C8R47DRAFT_1281388 [Mycena vitilis]|nr:hypothetical protein C8R47DRAFT_1281388 [Mycena vitilis]